MESSNISATTAPALADIGNSPAAARGVAPVQDFETFLTLLTAQMRNQDPINPVNSTDFVSQLASFSAVEQQVKANEMLAGMEALVRSKIDSSPRLRVGDMVELSSLTGTDGREMSFELSLPPAAENGSSRTLTVSDHAGTVLDSRSLPLDVDRYTYTPQGVSLSNGLSFTIVDSAPNGSGDRQPLRHSAHFQAEVEQALATSDGWMYQLNNGAVVGMQDLSF